MSAGLQGADSYLDVFVLRHGQSRAQTGEELGKDTGLSEHGRIQAKKAGEILSLSVWDRILCSPLLRAVETLECLHLQEKDSVGVVKDIRLAENTGKEDDNPGGRAESLLRELSDMASGEPAVRRVLIISHAMFLSSLLEVFICPSGAEAEHECGVYARLGNARLGFLRIPRQTGMMRVVAGWNISPQDLQNSEDGSF